jgi:hypothetical protein
MAVPLRLRSAARLHREPARPQRGNIIGALVVVALWTWGPRTGMGQMPLSRAAFGKSNVLPGVVNWASTIGWVASNNVFGATALKLLIHAPYWLGLFMTTRNTTSAPMYRFWHGTGRRRIRAPHEYR